MERLLPFSFVKRNGVLLKALTSDSATLWHLRPLSADILAELRRALGVPVQLTLVEQEPFDQQLAALYGSKTGDALQQAHEMTQEADHFHLLNLLPKSEDLLAEHNDAPIIKLLNALLNEAIKQSASDIHIESFATSLLIRLRIDGILRKVLEPQYQLAPLIISRIKVMAKLNIAEKRLPQDGRISLTIGSHQVDVRVSTLPTQYGERVVMRLLDKKTAPLDLAHLGMNATALISLKQLIAKPHGIILVTGPTGSGKTTTLYAALTALNNPTKNILTVEDPIEYNLSGIGQTQINLKANLTFAKGLRAILRQDPDIVMVGEIRDLETAKIAVQASLTGHLVLSTLHTNTAIGALNRLRDMGIEDYLLSSSVLGVIAQRLVRLLCPDCKQAYRATQSECALLEIAEPITLYKDSGCDACHYSGYRGRTGIYEIIPINEGLRGLITSLVSEQAMTQYARQLSPSIRQNGMQWVRAGKTSLAEVLRVIGE